MDDIYKNIEQYNRNKNRKILVLFDDMIADMLSNKKLRARKLNISLAFITQSYFVVPKNIRLNSTHYFVIKFPSKRGLQQIWFNHFSDIDLQDFMNLYRKSTAEPISCLFIDTIVATDNPLRFRNNLVEGIYKLIMTIDDKMRDEKFQDDINSEEAKISASSSRKIDKYEKLTGEEILGSNQRQIIDQARFAYSPLGTAFEKQKKTIEEQGKKQVKALEGFDLEKK